MCPAVCDRVYNECARARSAQVCGIVFARSRLSSFVLHSQISSAMSIKWFIVLIRFLVIYFIWLACSDIVTFNSHWTHSGHTFRFTALETRSGLAPVTPGISSFGLLNRGCKEPWLASNVTVDGASIVKKFHKPIEMTGWYLETSSEQGEIDNDPVRNV